ncbi:hypothetical protein [Bacillus sp. FJAT-45350]|uniref:hypothetical protein n=1 Tax=Bacillus sp. FJAT-45350 TaxID=2011014 RepID=UPI000BB87D47|nr:hypothetical protein [Bacillus sp. FJAT-45350]
MPKSEIYQKELLKLREIFEDVEEAKAKLVEGLIEDAAFIKAENYALKEILSNSGMVKVHPEHPELQKRTEAGKQFLSNVNSYATVIKTLNGVLMKNVVEGDDEFDDFMKEMRGNG